MLAAGIKSPVPLEELEAHLREEIDQLVKSGCSESEAFRSAAQRIGQANIVHGEFKKIEVKDARLWKLKEIGLVTFTSLFALMVARDILHFRTNSLVGLTPSQQISGLAALAAFILFIWGGRLGYKMFPVVPEKRRRSFITFCCIASVALWWTFYMCFIAQYYDFTTSQFIVSFLWAFVTPGGVLLGLVWGIETAARKRTSIAVS